MAVSGVSFEDCAVDDEPRLGEIVDFLVIEPHKRSNEGSVIVLCDFLRQVVYVIPPFDEPDNKNFENFDSPCNVDENKQESFPWRIDLTLSASPFQRNFNHRAESLVKDSFVNAISDEDFLFGPEEKQHGGPPEFLLLGWLWSSLRSLQNAQPSVLDEL